VDVKDPTGLSLLFHLNSEPWLDEEAYRGSPYVQEFKVLGSSRYSSLPTPPPSPLSDAIRRRRSSRAYSRAELSLEAVSRLLSDCYGATDVEPLDDGGAFLRRSVPSAGGLYPLELYIFARRIAQLEDGIYHYEARGQGLEQLRAGAPFTGLEPVFLTYPFVHDANLIVCFGADFRRTQKKYGPRGYRYILLEAGHAAQNLCLSAADLGLGSLCMGGFFDAALNALLGLRPLEEAIVYSVAVGREG
jgi:SagB-type dehydrogenase family enzyme